MPGGVYNTSILLCLQTKGWGRMDFDTGAQITLFTVWLLCTFWAAMTLLWLCVSGDDGPGRRTNAFDVVLRSISLLIMVGGLVLSVFLLTARVLPTGESALIFASLFIFATAIIFGILSLRGVVQMLHYVSRAELEQARKIQIREIRLRIVQRRRSSI